uniref:Uncharacterized protein n=1 Tax=Heterorhabditis bacteriophora TaxID=37862 RepID=A0A1I7X4B2_HETBA
MADSATSVQPNEANIEEYFFEGEIRLFILVMEKNSFDSKKNFYSIKFIFPMFSL